jgi:hypothetical protein
MTIRASQVIPVYPLTEDLQPGDVFLVQKTVKDQHNEYKKNGFLPIDNPLARLKPSGYNKFYSNSFPYINNDDLPKHWINIDRDTTTTLWHKAPLAAFPTYSFSVRSGGGGNIAVPVQGVPVALSFLSANTAEGTISISKSHTYGVDFSSLLKDIEKWENKNRDLLMMYYTGNERKKTNYLRVVSRVYLANEMDVSLYSTTKGAAAGSAGATKPVDLLLQETRDKKSSTPQTLDAYTKSVNSLNAMLETALAEKDSMGNILPGGTLKVTAVSDRSVSMKETFDRPLVIGYLGFDMAVGPLGILGPPIPTMALLTNKADPSLMNSPYIKFKAYSIYQKAWVICESLSEKNDKNAKIFKDKMDKIAQEIPQKYPVNIYTDSLEVYKNKNDAIEDRKDFGDFVNYWDTLRGSLEKLKERENTLNENQKKDMKSTEKEIERLDNKFEKRRNVFDKSLHYALMQ